jgi:hypothetical protein
MLHKISVTAAVLVLLLAGLLHRSWTDYWRTAPALVEAAALIEKVPLAIGSWRGQTLEVDAEDLALAGYNGCVWRRYQDSSSGTSVSMLLVCGRPGPVSVHTPDACYGGVGYERMGAMVQVKVPALSPAEPAVFWQADFVKPGQASSRQLRIYWSWHTGEGWQAVENPRLTFMNEPVLFKLYVVCEITSADDTRKTDACREFMTALLPEMQKLLSPPAPLARARTPLPLEVRTACTEL